MTPAERQVVEHPADLDGRLALAAEVAATDPDLARFVRNGVTLARLQPDDPAVAALEREQRLLFRRRAKARLYAPHAAWLAAPVLHGGWVEGGTVDTTEFLANVDAHFASLPLRHLVFTAVRPQLRRLLAAPWLRKLVSLDLPEAGLHDQDVALLAARPDLDGLRYLGLANNPIGDAAVEALAASPHLRELRYVDLRGTRASPIHRTAIQDQGEVVGYLSCPMAARLVARFGRRAWLDRADPVAPSRTRV